MRLNTTEEIKEYEGKTLWLVKNNDLFEIKIHMSCIYDKNDKPRELTNDEFTWAYASQPIGLRLSSLFETAVFTDKDEAKTYMLECLSKIVISEDLADTTIDIYKGNFCSGMERINKELFDWTIDCEYMGMTCRNITLKNIYKQSIEKGFIKNKEMLTVFCTGSLRGTIYQCGNHGDGIWEIIGKTNGYA